MVQTDGHHQAQYRLLAVLSGLRLEHGDDELMVLFILMVNIMRPPLTILF